MSPDPASIAAGVDRVRAELASGGADPDAVRIVAVTKAFGAEVASAALAAGLTDLGESYAQELVAKAPEVTGEPTWHFVGNLQSNKVRTIAPLVSWWHSLDRTSVIDEVAKRAEGARVLLQVDAAGDPDKGGCAPDDAPGLIARARDRGLDVVGVMAVGVAGDDEATEDCFRVAARIADRFDLPERSFGMTADLAAAARCGTTMVRVGTVLFGPRPTR